MSTVDASQIPLLPTPPPPAPRSTPKGLVEAKASDTPPRVTGRWRQQDGNASADFLPGGYTASTLTFREGGILEVTRTFGGGEGTTSTWRIGHEWADKGTRLVVGKEEKRRPPAESLKVFPVPGGVMQAPVQALPLALRCERLKDGRIRLGDKMYVPIKLAWDSFVVPPPADQR